MSLVDGLAYERDPSTTKATNPKDAIGSTKAPLSLVPLATMSALAVAHANGMMKYGKVNWREAGVRASIYVDAALRHLMVWNEGEERDPDDEVDNLAAALACISILIDARTSGKLTDDRPKSLPNPRAPLHAAAERIGGLKVLHEGKDPVHHLVGGPSR